MNQKQREKAVAIAYDVLKQVKILSVEQGVYLSAPPLNQGLEGESLQKHMDELVSKGKNCTVCALGACFLSHVKLYNKFKIDDNLTGGPSGDGHAYVHSDDMFELLHKSLGVKNMVLIESAFECGACLTHHAGQITDEPDWDEFSKSIEKVVTQEEIRAAVEHGRSISDPADRLKAIMRNLIKNDGEYTPKITKENARQTGEAREAYWADKQEDLACNYR